MTIKELIAILSKEPSESEIYVQLDKGEDFEIYSINEVFSDDWLAKKSIPGKYVRIIISENV